MSSDLSRRRVALLTAAALALCLAGCGRRGPLEAPPDPAAEAAKAREAGAGVDQPVGRPVGRRNRDTRITPPRVDTPADFLL